MSLPVVVTVAILGVLFIIVVVHLVGGSAPTKLESVEQVTALMLEREPSVLVSKVHIAPEKDFAVIELQGRSEVGLVHVLGHKYIVGVLGVGSLRGLDAVGHDTLCLRFKDFGRSPRKIKLHDELTLKHWRHLLEGCLHG